jgi:putative phosphoesterase
MVTVGVISDTHGLLRPEAVAALRRVDHIIHAGDIGTPEILSALATIAPLTAVRGNNDRGSWARAIPETSQVKIGGRSIYVLHDLAELELDHLNRAIDVVVSGHSHKPRVERHEGVLLVNPGSAGPRRFNLPISLAILTIADRAVRAKLIELPASAAQAPARATRP